MYYIEFKQFILSIGFESMNNNDLYLYEKKYIK